MDIHEIEYNRKLKAAATEQHDIDSLVSSSIIVNIASALMGFYLFDAIYNFDYSEQVAKALATDPWPLNLEGEYFKYLMFVLGNIIMPCLFAISSELLPAHLILRGFRKSWMRLLMIVVTAYLSCVTAFNVGGKKSLTVMIIALSLFAVSSAMAYNRAYIIIDAKKKR